ncbi:hypothetical protein VI06_11770 [Aquitalea magnusonii]|nr:hypothetical protein VI06_11770 [Aquitalea magnusonii]
MTNTIPEEAQLYSTDKPGSIRPVVSWKQICYIYGRRQFIPAFDRIWQQLAALYGDCGRAVGPGAGQAAGMRRRSLGCTLLLGLIVDTRSR